MRAKSTRGYVLKVAVASASIGCATLTACEAQHAVGTVAMPPRADAGPVEPSPSAAPPIQQTAEVGTVARPPDAPDAAVAPKPTEHKVGIIARPPDIDLTVGTTARAPDRKPPAKK